MSSSNLLRLMSLCDSQTVGCGFADMHGRQFSRDIEPTVDGGSALYDLMASCIRVFRTGALVCGPQFANEVCCARGAFNRFHRCLQEHRHLTLGSMTYLEVCFAFPTSTVNS